MNYNLILEPVESSIEIETSTEPITPPIEDETVAEPITPPVEDEIFTEATTPPIDDETVVYPAYDNLVVEVELTTVSAICVHDNRPFLTTPIDTYNVTEGFLLIICFLLSLVCVLKAVK